MILVDTSVWIDLFTDRNTVQVKLLESLIEQSEDLCICGVILTEILQGIRDEKEYKTTESLLSELLLLPMERDTFLLAAQIYRTLRSKGITIRNSVDCMIAAVCIENEVEILHKDKDFEVISSQFDLKIRK
ncbi:MAG: twitching motility protein PilT [Candidatus Schekmanbacteria bacterium RBG_13_48_7]|uniref:Ribonuclease VapC n=1 Tax=Candidatus Schekmanbacteria bacterium RBG_13_48_7 TaxID=1817878 RepID=A0A1F7RV54_9BACT|nr:MAG: twitching motility protein PilT [Candidatus Schekmanbacteria bacterium RBG_13_48_7]